MLTNDHAQQRRGRKGAIHVGCRDKFLFITNLCPNFIYEKFSKLSRFSTTRPPPRCRRHMCMVPKKYFGIWPPFEKREREREGERERERERAVLLAPEKNLEEKQTYNKAM